MYLILFTYVFGGAISGSTHKYLQQSLPGVLVLSVVFATLGTGMMLSQDISTGVFDRFRALPIVRWAPLAGAILGDLIRYLISILVTLGFGYVLGFRVQTSALAAVMGCLLLMAFAFAMCWMSAMLGVLAKSAQGVQWWGFLLMFPLVFGSNILTPTRSMPGWLQAFVKVNPVTYLTEAERALLTGGPAATTVERSLLWAVGSFVVFAPIALPPTATARPDRLVAPDRGRLSRVRDTRDSGVRRALGGASDYPPFCAARVSSRRAVRATMPPEGKDQDGTEDGPLQRPE